MPEIAEVARCVHYLRKHVVSGRVKTVATSGEDPIIYLTSKTGLTAPLLSSKLEGKKVVAAKQQGKYFWLEFEKPPHLLCHFGMTGWIKFKGHESADYQQMKKMAKSSKSQDADDSASPDADEVVSSVMTAPEEWPPRFWKFILKLDSGAEAAFVDPRRLGRVRLIDVPAAEMRTTSPLAENGPDPVIDKDKISSEWFAELVQRKRVPIKSLLLDQAVLSGVGNWVADETLYHARVHPEHYSNELTTAQAEKVRESLLYVCDTACELLGDSTRFPDHWLMRHRWKKGQKDATVLPNGERISYVTVGGRTSAFVASRQRKSDKDVEDSVKQPSSQKRKAEPEVKDEGVSDVKEKVTVKKTKKASAKEETGRRRSTRNVPKSDT